MTVSSPNVIEIKLDRLIEDMRFLRSHMIAFDKRLNGIEAYLKPSEPSEQQPNDDFDVLADGTVVGRIYEATQSACSNSSSVIAIVPYNSNRIHFLFMTATVRQDAEPRWHPVTCLTPTVCKRYAYHPSGNQNSIRPRRHYGHGRRL
jgi:hypothetical protein